MKSLWKSIGLLLTSLLIASYVTAAPISAKQEMKQHKMEKKQTKMEMKHNVKSYGEVVLEQSEVLSLSDEQLGKIMRISMTNKKSRKELLDKPHKSMKKALKALRDPSADTAMIRKAGANHTADFDVLVEAEIKIRKKIDDVLTSKQRVQLKAIKLPVEEKAAE